MPDEQPYDLTVVDEAPYDLVVEDGAYTLTLSGLGAQGIPGPAGPTGATGATGPAGPNSVTSTTTSDGTANLSLAAATVTGTLTANHIHGNLAGSIYLHVRAGEALSKGDPVYVSGSHGTGASMVPIVMRADASNAAKMPAIAIMDAAVANNGDGHAVINGTITDLNTQAYAINSTLYVANGGGMTATKPTNAQPVARVERSNLNNGGIVVKVNGLYSDVTIASSQVTDATSAATPNTIVKRGANGQASFAAGTGLSPAIYASRSGGGLPVALFENTGIGSVVVASASSGDALQATSATGDYHSLFGNISDDRSFVARVKGAFGWVRGAFTGRIQADDILTGNHTYILPDIGGEVILDTTLGAGVSALNTINFAKSFSGQVQLTGQAATDDNSAMTRGLADARYLRQFIAGKTSETSRGNTNTPTSDPTLIIAVPEAGSYSFEAFLRVRTSASGGGSVSGLKFGLLYSGSATVASSYIGWVVSIAASTARGAFDSFGSYADITALNNGENQFSIRGIITASTAGNFSISWSPYLVNATESTVMKVGSYLQLVKLP